MAEATEKIGQLCDCDRPEKFIYSTNDASSDQDMRAQRASKRRQSLTSLSTHLGSYGAHDRATDNYCELRSHLIWQINNSVTS